MMANGYSENYVDEHLRAGACTATQWIEMLCSVVAKNFEEERRSNQTQKETSMILKRSAWLS